MMMRRLLTFLALVLPIAAMSQIRIGVVDVADIYGGLPRMAQAKATIEAEGSRYNAELDKLKRDFQLKYTEYQAVGSDPATPQIIKDRRVQELQELDRKIQAFLVEVADKIESREKELITPVVNEVKAAIDAVGREKGYTIIYADLSPSAATQSSAGMQPVYMGENVDDLTSEVKLRLGIIPADMPDTQSTPE